MNQPRVGLVGVTCKYESGGQRAEELLSGIKDALKKKNLDVVCAEKVAWDSADAIDVCKQFKKENLDALVIVEVTWTLDSMQYLFQSPYCILGSSIHRDILYRICTAFRFYPESTGI